MAPPVPVVGGEASGAGSTVAAAEDVVSLVARAALPWSPETHELFPDRARARAVLLRHVGRHMREYGVEEWQRNLPADVWERHVIAHAVSRSTC